MPPADGSPFYPGQEEPLKRLAKTVNAFLARADSGPFREPVDWRGLELWDYPDVIKHMMDLGTIKRKLDRDQYSTAAACAADIRLVWNNCMAYNAPNSDFWLLAKAFSKRFEDRYRKVKNEFDVGEEYLEKELEELRQAEKVSAGASDIGTGSSNSKKAEVGDDDEDKGGDDDEDEEEEEDLEEEDDDLALHGNKSSNLPPSLDTRARLAANLLLLNGIELGHVIAVLERKCPAALEDLSGSSSAVPGKMEIVMDALDSPVFSELHEYVQERIKEHNKHQHQHQRTGWTEAAIDDISNKRKRKR